MEERQQTYYSVVVCWTILKRTGIGRVRCSKDVGTKALETQVLTSVYVFGNDFCFYFFTRIFLKCLYKIILVLILISLWMKNLPNCIVIANSLKKMELFFLILSDQYMIPFVEQYSFMNNLPTNHISFISDLKMLEFHIDRFIFVSFLVEKI